MCSVMTDETLKYPRKLSHNESNFKIYLGYQLNETTPNQKDFYNLNTTTSLSQRHIVKSKGVAGYSGYLESIEAKKVIFCEDREFRNRKLSYPAPLRNNWVESLTSKKLSSSSSSSSSYKLF